MNAKSIITTALVVLFVAGYFAYTLLRNVECRSNGGVLVNGLGPGGWVCVEPLK